jgi:carboxypeptidase C (cathepsin A)
MKLQTARKAVRLKAKGLDLAPGGIMRRFSSRRGLAAIATILGLAAFDADVIAQRQATTGEGAGAPRRGLHQPLPQVTLEKPIVTHHSGIFHGKKIDYTATVEPIVVPDAAGKAAARLVVISYTADQSAANRPALFAFNGGPIAPSGIIHFGLLGPRRLEIPDDIKADASTFRTVDNEHSPLDVADLVFFDPAETGYSRALPGVDFNTAFTSVATDAQELTGLVIEWSKAHDRTGAPKFLVGESYGTMRAAESANQLMKAGTPPAGVVLLGQALNIIEYSQRPDNIISYAVSLPTLAATGWFHNKAERKGRTFAQFMKDAEDYGAGEYLAVLFLGQRAPLSRRQAVARKLQELTGLSADFYMKHNLKVAKALYQASLLPGQMLNTNDARYSYPVGQPDPFAKVLSTMEKAFLDYLHSELKVGDIGIYCRENPAPPGLNAWDWGPNKSPFGNWPYVQSLTEVFHAQPSFRLMVADGYTDTQTTVGAQDYLIGNAYWPADRVRTRHYHGGHMFYTVAVSARAVNDDIRAMIAGGAW